MQRLLIFICTFVKVVVSETISDGRTTFAKIFTEVIHQNDLNGFNVYNVCPYKTPLEQITNSVLQTISNLASVTLMNPRVKGKKFEMSRPIVSDDTWKEKSRIRGVSPFVLASSNYLPVVIVTADYIPARNYLLDPAIQMLRSNFNIFNTPKLLIVCIYKKHNFNFREVSEVFFKGAHADTEIVAIRMMERSISLHHNRTKLYFNVHQLNYFTKVYKNCLYKPEKVKWLTNNKSRNIHKYAMHARLLVSQASSNFEPIHGIQTLKRAIKLMNGSCRVVAANDRKQYFGEFKRQTLYKINRSRPWLIKPIEYLSYNLLVPVIYDTKEISWNFDTIVLTTSFMTSIFLIFYLCHYLANTDERTRGFLVFARIFFGNRNSRLPVIKAEIAMLLCCLTVGGFFAINLRTALIDTNFVAKKERMLQGLGDLRDNNITVLLFHGDVGPRKSKFYYADIFQSKLKHAAYRSTDAAIPIKDLVMYQNITIANTLLYLWFNVRIPERIVVNNRLMAKSTGIKHNSLMYTWIVYRRLAYFNERLSDLYWRITETESPICKQNLASSTIVEQIKELEINFNSDDVLNEINLHNLWLIILVGSLMALISLLIERQEIHCYVHCEYLNLNVQVF